MPPQRTSPQQRIRRAARALLRIDPQPDPWEAEFEARNQAAKWLSEDSKYLAGQIVKLQRWMDRSTSPPHMWAFYTAYGKATQLLAEMKANSDAVDAFNAWAREAIPNHCRRSGSPPQF
jgi:hypothetical protein